MSTQAEWTAKQIMSLINSQSLETQEEIREMCRDLASAGVSILTIGQYLPPSRNHWPLARYVHPDEFAGMAEMARDQFGFDYVVSAPLVRSSYKAAEAVDAAKQKRRGRAEREV